MKLPGSANKNKKAKKKIQKKQCCICHAWYEPDLRTCRHQTCCSKESCRKERKRRANKSWQVRHPGYDQSRNAKKRDWAQAYPDYWQLYRQDHPEYVLRDNQRRKKSHKRAKNAANQDAIATISVEQLAGIPRFEPQNAANQVVMDRRVDQVIDWLVSQVRAARQDGIVMHRPGMP